MTDDNLLQDHCPECGEWESECRCDELDPELCAMCGKPATGLATVNDDRLCHGDDDPTPTCYERAQSTSKGVARASAHTTPDPELVAVARAALELSSEATPAPWRSAPHREFGQLPVCKLQAPEEDPPTFVYSKTAWLKDTQTDARFIAFARSALPRLAEAVLNGLETKP